MKIASVELTSESFAPRPSKTGIHSTRRANSWLPQASRRIATVKLPISGFDPGEPASVKILVLTEQHEVATFRKAVESGEFLVRKVRLNSPASPQGLDCTSLKPS